MAALIKLIGVRYKLGLIPIKRWNLLTWDAEAPELLTLLE